MQGMIRSIVFLLLYLVFSTVMIPVSLVTGLFRLLQLYSLERRYASVMAGFISWFYLFIAGVKIDVEGIEHLEGLRGKPVCVVGNHQGMADIPVVINALPFSIGFIAKRSLSYFPWVGVFMWMIRCVPIDRLNPRSAIKAIEAGGTEHSQRFSHAYLSRRNPQPGW